MSRGRRSPRLGRPPAAAPRGDRGPRVRRRYRLRTSGLLYLAVTLLLGVAASTRPNNMLVWIFGMMLGSILMSGIVSGGMLMGLRARRLGPRTAAVGEASRFRYELWNRSRLWPAFGLVVREQEVGGREGWEQATASAPAAAVHVGPQELVHAESWFVPDRRGRFELRGVVVASTFPLGLLEKSLSIEDRSHLLVHPRRLSLRRGLLAALRGEGSGMVASSRGGVGEEFFGVREHRPGDSLRQVAWKRSAGLDRLATIERARLGPSRLVIHLNLLRPTDRLSADPAGPPPRELEETAISLASSIADAAVLEGFEVGLAVLGAAVVGEGSPEGGGGRAMRSEAAGEAAGRMAVRGGRRHLDRLQGVLAAIDLDAPRTPSPAAAAWPGGQGRSCLEVVIHPDRADRSLGGDAAWHFTAASVGTLRETASTRAAAAGPEEAMPR
jgi:uncharacterized protein (DUF58 family)